MNRYNIEKVSNAIIYFIENGMKHLGKTKLMKLMFFSDKQHLSSYGRTVFDDEYYKYQRGPVAHLTLSILNSVNEVENDDLALNCSIDKQEYYAILPTSQVDRYFIYNYTSGLETVANFLERGDN